MLKNNVINDVIGNTISKVIEDGGTPPPIYSQNRSLFDGINDSLFRGTSLDGVFNSFVGSFSTWFVINGGDNSERYFIGNQNNSIRILLNSSNRVEVLLRNSSNTTMLLLDSTITLSSGTDVHSLLVSWNLNTLEAEIFLDDIDVTNTITIVSGQIAHNRSQMTIGAENNGTNFFNGCLSDFYYNIGDYADFKVAASRRLFIDGSGNPVFLGINGEIPSGFSPILFFDNPFNSFELNNGTGGDFSQVGALTECL